MKNRPKFQLLQMLLAILALTTSLRAELPVKVDSILDQPISVKLLTNLDTPCTLVSKSDHQEHFMLTIPPYQQCISLIEKLSGKKVVQPKGMPVWQESSRLETGNGGLGVSSDEPLRNFISRICSISLGLKWHYDGKQDVIVLDYPWTRDDPRSLKELADALIETNPVSWKNLPADPQPNQVGGHGMLLDPWRVAFDGLLSKPENYLPCSAVRFFHNTHGNTEFAAMTDPDTLFSGKVCDNNGQEMILVLNKQESPSTESGPGDVAYYLFDTGGRFLKGGVYSLGGFRGLVYRADVVDGQNLKIEVPGFGQNTKLINFQLLNGDLVFQGWIDSQGKETKAIPSQLIPIAYGGTNPGQLKYRVEGSAVH